ncbi:hypothetical protein [Streptosporangium lutulentum]|uniref:Uncharacterized protein n=1 Tax=Streptosporangium lutulentum TaxID=1461250 RepID=A0ABT9Q961_9ACTN|nr:hypothetical protein [Streptosporangium lutulentum]MDP9843287.1 hypothetical protein [Streptosporangium lutulentum]
MNDKPMYGFNYDGAGLETTRRALLEGGLDPSGYLLTYLETGVRVEHDNPETVRAAHAALSLLSRLGRCSMLTLPTGWAPETETAIFRYEAAMRVIADEFEAAQRAIANQARRIVEQDRSERAPDRKMWKAALRIPVGREAEIWRLLEERGVEVYRVWEVQWTPRSAESEAGA